MDTVASSAARRIVSCMNIKFNPKQRSRPITGLCSPVDFLDQPRKDSNPFVHPADISDSMGPDFASQLRHIRTSLPLSRKLTYSLMIAHTPRSA